MGMAFPWDVSAYILVFVIVVAVLVRMATKARSQEAQLEQASEADSGRDTLLLRFVEDSMGRRVGETVAIEGDDLVVKDAKGFLLVPVASISESGPGLRITGPLDEADARRKGDAWRERSHKVITYQPDELPRDDPEA